MLAAPGVSGVCSDVSRSKSDRVRVENALCRAIRITANGADDMRTVYWRTTVSGLGYVSVQGDGSDSNRLLRLFHNSPQNALPAGVSTQLPDSQST
jgi:hypothetical protein